mgnify:CR=1 FL=1
MQSVATHVTVKDIVRRGCEHAKNDAVSIGRHAWNSLPDGVIAAQQGDIYIWKLGSLPQDVVEVEPYHQLAPGQTLGSRHCLISLEGVRMYQKRQPGPLDGPYLWLEDGPATITHPVHGDIVDIPQGAILHITYQRLYADTVRRVMD